MTRTWRISAIFILMVTAGSLRLAAQAPNAPARQAPNAPIQTVPQAPAQTPPAQPAQTAAPQQTAPAPQTPVPAQDPLIDSYTVGQARPPLEPGAELIELTLDQAQALALEKNLDLKVARMNPISTDYQLQTYRGAYRPNFNASYSYRNALTPSNSTLDGVLSVTNVNQGFNGGFSQLLNWYGSPNFSVSWTNSRTSTNNVTARLNPQYTAGLSFTGSINLLNGFKIDTQRNNFRTFPITREIADITLLNSIETTKSSVRTAYWQLRQAIEQIEIASRALELAKKSYADSLIKVEIGTSAQIDTVAFEAAVPQNEQVLLAAQIAWQQAELNFKRLIVNGTDDPLYRKTINPTDRPELSVASVDIQGAVTKTLAEATNMVIARKNLDVRRLTFEVTQQVLKPNLSANGGYNASGQAGTQHLNDGTIIQGGYFDAFGILGNFTNPSWNLGFNLTYRLGQLQERASVATAQIAIDQAVAQLKAQELTTATAVVNAGLAVSNSYKQYQAAVKNREAQERNTAAAQVRFDNGLLTNFEVVQQQNSLTNSRLSELRALISYVNAIADFERVQKIGG